MSEASHGQEKVQNSHNDVEVGLDPKGYQDQILVLLKEFI